MSTLSPGHLALAPLGAGDLIDRAVRLYRRHLFVLIRTAAPPCIIVAAGWILFSISIRRIFVADRSDDLVFYVVVWLLSIAMMLGGYLFTVVVMGGATRTLVAHLLRNDPVTARATYAAVRSRFWGLLSASLIVLLWIFASLIAASSGGQMAMFVFGLAALALINIAPAWLPITIAVIGAIVTTVFSLWLFFFVVGSVAYVPQVMLVEGKGVIDAVGRSFSLARGNVRRLMAMTLFTTFATYSALMILAAPLAWYGYFSGVELQNPSQWPVWFAIAYSVLGPLSSILLTPVWMLGLSLLYVDERVRHEGYDIELMAARQLGELPDINVSSPLGTALHSERKDAASATAGIRQRSESQLILSMLQLSINAFRRTAALLVVICFVCSGQAVAIPIADYQQRLNDAIASLEAFDQIEDDNYTELRHRVCRSH